MNCRRGPRRANLEVLLEQRSPQATVMPGMWELPRFEGSSAILKPLLNVRHSIMRTNYRISIIEAASIKKVDYANSRNERWIRQDELNKLPLTGLARKILLRLRLIVRQ